MKYTSTEIFNTQNIYTYLLLEQKYFAQVGTVKVLTCMHGVIKLSETLLQRWVARSKGKPVHCYTFTSNCTGHSGGAASKSQLK